MNKKILIIDSGVGGISTLFQIRQFVTKADIIYFADDLFLPYGNKDPDDLFLHLVEVIERFEDQICGVVLACNTATGVAIEKLRKIFCFQIVGTEPAIVPACKDGKKALVLVTPLESEQYKFLRLAKNKNIVVLKMPFLAKSIDDFLLLGGSVSNLGECKQIVEQVKQIVEIAEKNNTKKIVLGCTHYVFLKHLRTLDSFELFDGNLGVAKRVACVFENVGTGQTHFVFDSGNKKKSQIALRLLNELANS